VILDPGQSAAARHCVVETIRRRRWSGEPIPRGLYALLAHLSNIGPERHVTEPGSVAAPPPRWIDAHEAALIVGCSSRHIRRLAADLDGRRLRGVWIFDHQTVAEYAAAKREKTPP
jgi:hypothetical protein